MPKGQGTMKNTRREFIKTGAAMTAALSVSGLVGCAGSGKDGTKLKQGGTVKNVQWPVTAGPHDPKLMLICPVDATPEYMRMLKQIGIDYVLLAGARFPWTEGGLRSIMDRFNAERITVYNMMIPTSPKIVFNQEGRDQEVKLVQDSLHAAGKAGLPIVEYNFYAHRLTEGYYRPTGRGGAGLLGYDYSLSKDLPPLPGIGAYTYEQLWDNITYFLEAIIPVAEKAGVRMALHPNDPPVPVSRGSQQIMGTFNDWKRLVDIVDSPSNGMTYDCGVSKEIGEDPLEVLDYLISRDRVNHVHYRNVIVESPREKYVEVFLCEGTVDMFAVMQQLVQRKYRFGLYPEHPQRLDYDITHPLSKGGSAGANQGGQYAGFVYTTAYARGMWQAAMTIEKRKS